MMSIPHLFRCPISLDLFTDPVTLSTGQTYNRPSIEKWLAAGNITCPVTMQKLEDTTVVPNHALRHLIDQWLLSGVEPDNTSTLIDNGEGTVGASLFTLKRNLCSKNATFESKMRTLRMIRILSVESDTGRHCLIQLGFFPLLLELLFQSPPLRELQLVEVALDCALNLSTATELDRLNMLKERSNLSAMVNLIEYGNTKIKTSLCRLIEVITTSTTISPVTEDLCLQIGQQKRVFQILISLLSSQTTESEAAVRAVAGLCSFEPSRPIAIHMGLIDGIVAYLSSPARRNVGRALATLEALVTEESGAKALVVNPAAVRVLVKLVFRVSAKDDGGSEHAAGLLIAICSGSKTARTEAVNSGVLSQLLLLLQSQCGSEAKAKGRALLKLLRSMWDDDL